MARDAAATRTREIGNEFAAAYKDPAGGCLGSAGRTARRPGARGRGRPFGGRALKSERRSKSLPLVSLVVAERSTSEVLQNDWLCRNQPRRPRRQSHSERARGRSTLERSLTDTRTGSSGPAHHHCVWRRARAKLRLRLGKEAWPQASSGGVCGCRARQRELRGLRSARIMATRAINLCR